MIIDTAPRTPIEPARVSRPKRRILACICISYLVATVGLWLFMREFGDRWWPGTLLLLAPRWPFALPLLLLWPWALVTRSWRSVGVTAAATAAMLLPVMGFQVNLKSGGSERGQLRLLTCNIHRQHLDAARFAAFIAEVHPDIVALQGWSDMHQEALFTEPGWEVHRQGELLLASRFPIGDIRPIKIADDDPEVVAGEKGSAAVFEVRLPQGPIHVVSLHLASPHAGLNEMWTDRGQKLTGNIERRWRESAHVREVVEHTKGTLLLAGDFNTVSESPLFREHWEGFTNAFSDRGTGLGHTYLVNHTQIRIDHILADSSCQFVRCWVGPDVSAAHRPLVADIDFR